MPTYRQRHTIYEDGYGTTSVLFVMADTYDNLFAVSGVHLTNVFVIGSVKTDLDFEAGVLAQDELNFNVIEAAAETADDLDAIAFYKQGQDPDVKRYCALFINASDLPTAPEISKAVFIGQMYAEQKGNDVQHHGALWSKAINPLREWQTRAGTFMDSVVDKIELKDLIYGNDDLMVTGIDEAWETAHVADRVGWHKSPSGDPSGARTARFSSIVSLNAVLRLLADNVVATLAAQGLGTYVITFLDADFDWKTSPARYYPLSYGVGGDPSWPSRHVDEYRRNDPFTGDRNPFIIKANDASQLGLGDTQPETSQVWINYRMVKPEGKTEQQFSFLRCKSFTELLYGLATSLGCYVKFYQPTPSDIVITFVPRKDIELPEVFIRDIEAGDINLTVATQKDDNAVYGISGRYAMDGADSFWNDNDLRTASGPKASKRFNDTRKGKAALLTVSPTVVYFWKVEDANWKTYGGGLPMNGVFYVGSTIEAYAASDEGEGIVRSDKGFPTIHTGIYIKTSVNGEFVDPGTDPVWLPAAMVHANIDGVDQNFDSLTEYVNAITARDGKYFKAEYNLTVPYLNGFSTASDGSAPGWENVKAGSKVVLQEDGIDKEFLVIGIERICKEPTTKLRLQYISRMEFSTPAAPSTPQTIEPLDIVSGGDAVPTSSSPTRSYTAHEDIKRGDALVAFYNGSAWRVKRMRAHSDDYDSFIGIALYDAVAGTDVSAQPSGRLVLADYAFTPGQAVYVRSSSLPTLNVSQSLLTGPNSEENMIANIGTADTESSFVIDLFRQTIFEVR